MNDIWNIDFEWKQNETYVDKTFANYAKTGIIYNTTSGVTLGENLPSNHITSFYDFKKYSKTYVGTNDGGVFVFDYVNMSGYTINSGYTVSSGTTLPSNTIYSLTIDEYDEYLYVTTDNSIWRLNLHNNSGETINNNFNISGDTVPNSGISHQYCNIVYYKNSYNNVILYFGFENDGIWEFNSTTNVGKIINTSTPVYTGSTLMDNKIWQLAINEDSEILYAATPSGVWSNMRTLNTGKNYYGYVPAIGDSCPTGTTRTLYLDCLSDILYIGFEDDGFWQLVISSDIGDHFNTSDITLNLPSDRVEIIKKDCLSDIIYVSSGSGETGVWEYNLQTNEYQIYDIANTTSAVTYGFPLPDNYVTCVSLDSNSKFLFVGTPSEGLWRYNYNVEYVDALKGGEIIRVEREQLYEVDNINDIYFKLQKAFSGITFTYADNINDVYKFDLLTGDGYSLENLFNEYDVINKYLKNYVIVDVASTENVDISNVVYKIDEVVLKPTHKVLLKNQTDSTQNDIYVVTDKYYLERTDYLSTRDKSDKFKCYVKLGEINKNKQWFLYYNLSKLFPTSFEQKEFVEKHSYIIKHKLLYDINTIATSTGTTHKLLFSDYDIARKMNSKNHELWSGFTMDISTLTSGDVLDIYYYNSPYRITMDKTASPYDEYIKMDINCIPEMTSNTTPSGVCYASSVFNNLTLYQPWKAFDHSTLSSWKSSQPSATLQYEFEEPTIIWKYAIYFNDGSVIETAPKNWTFEGSKDGSSWDILDTRFAQTFWSGETNNIYREFEIENKEDYIYYKLDITDNNGDDAITCIGELEMFNIVLVTGLTSFIPYELNSIYNKVAYVLDSGYTETYDTVLITSGFTDLSLLNVNEYIDIEFRKNGDMFSRFKTFIKETGTTSITISDLIPEWVIKEYNIYSESGLTWIIRNTQYTNPTSTGLITALEESFISKFFNVEKSGVTELLITPKEDIYNKEFDYGSLSFVFSGNTYKFHTDNSYIDYNLMDFLSGVTPIVFTPTQTIYNDEIFTNSEFNAFFVDLGKEIIQLNISGSSVMNNFKNFTYVNISGATNTGRTLILKLEYDNSNDMSCMWLERPKNFGATIDPDVVQIQNLKELKQISDTLYDVYKNENYDYYIPKNDFIRKNIYLNYGFILDESDLIKFYCLGLLFGTLDIDRKFILKFYKLEDDDNIKLLENYRPIEVLDVGVDKKTMIPKPLIYPDYFIQTDRIDDLYLSDYNVLDGNEFLTYIIVDPNFDDDIVIDDNV
jgi:hypothetical protein